MGSSPSFPVVSLPREKVVLITGANTGIGYEAAKEIAMMGATVIIACRSEQRATDAIARMNTEYREKRDSGGLKEGHINEDSLPLEFMKLDLASLKSTMDFINAFKSSGRKLHVLLCNAGLVAAEGAITEDGYEMHFQVNYLGHFLIVAHLLPTMKTSGEDCRIVMTSSIGHKYGRFSMDNIKSNDLSGYSAMKYYSNSKLYQILHMFSLSRRIQGSDVTVTSIHPGAVKTDIGRGYREKWYYCCLKCCTGCFFISSPKGAITLIDAAVNPRKKGMTAVYLVDCSPASIAADGRNQTYQEDLWSYSLECLKNYIPDDVKLSLEGNGQNS